MLPNPWLTKPPQGTGLNRTIGLTRGLAAFWPMLEDGGPNTYDLVGQVPLAITGQIWSSGLTSGLACTVNGQGAQLSLPAALQLPLPLTLAVGFRLLATPANTCAIFGLEGSSGRLASIEVNSSPGVNFQTASFSMSGSIAAGADCVAIATAQSGNTNLYLNAIPVASNPGTYSLTYSGASPYLAVSGPAFFTGARNPASLIYWGAIWSRTLTLGEISAVSSNPWQMLAPNPSYWLYRSGSAVFSFTGSGGVIGGGSASPSSAYAPPAAGGVELGGAAAGSLIVTASAAGGVELGGSATHAATYTTAPAGGIELGGTAILPGTFSFTGSGGIELGGTASESFAAIAAASGGVALGGVAIASPGPTSGGQCPDPTQVLWVQAGQCPDPSKSSWILTLGT